MAKVFEAHRPRLEAMVRRRLDPSLAARMDPDDILSETFLRARARWPGHDPAVISTFAWLYRIALDCVMDAWRTAHADKRSPKREVPWPDRSSAQLALGLVGSLTTPSVELARSELQERMEKALGQLSPDDREILVMRHFDDLSSQETAAVLGITHGAAMKRYTRAMLRLKRLWNEIEPEDDV